MFFSFLKREMSPARWGHPGGCPPAGPASNVVSGKVEKIRENKEHLVPGPFTWNNKDRKVRLFLLVGLRESGVGSKEAEDSIDWFWF